MKLSRMEKSSHRSSWREWAKDISIMLAGSLIAAFAVNVFYVPNKLTMGGVSGIVSIIYQLTGKGEFLPFGVMFILLNIPLVLLGWRMINMRFIWRSFVGTVVYSVLIDLTGPGMSSFYSQYIDRPLAKGGADPLIYCVFGGIIYGVGLGMVFRGGFTTGGTDILAMVIRRKFKILSTGQFIMLLDASIVLASIFAYHDVAGPGILMGMYSFIAMYLTSKSIDILLEGFDYCRAAYIISDRSSEIAQRIMHQMNRGVTSLKGRGMYTGSDKEVLLCVLSKKQIPDIKEIVSEVDPDAFVIVVEAREVLGEGFGSATEF